MTRPIILLLSVYILYSCERSKNDKQPLDKNTISENALQDSSQLENSVILCDSIYPNKNYRITLRTLDTFSGDETIFNALFTLSAGNDGSQIELYRDSVYNTAHDVVFEDFNSDGIKDILVQSYSDGRSNWTYYLYLVDTSTNRLKKIKGFETIKNPKWNSEFKLIENYVLSGMNWTSFYDIEADSIRDYNIFVEEDLRDSNRYEGEYKKAIKKVQSIRKNNR